MKTDRKFFSRRTFLITSGAVTSGFIIGFSKLGKNQEKEDVEEFEPNGWLKIDKDGRATIVFARSEMGQGISTALPMIVAEELSINWDDVEVKYASHDPSTYGNQGTYSNSSVISSWHQLRMAGAAARHMLISAAASTWHVKSEDCRAENGYIVHVKTKRKLYYKDLIFTAAKLPLPQEINLKKNKDFKLLGTSPNRVDSIIKSNGKALYAIDIDIPQMHFATVLRPPFGSEILSFDTNGVKEKFHLIEVIQYKYGIAVIARDTWSALEARKLIALKTKKNIRVNSSEIKKELKKAVRKEGVPLFKEIRDQSETKSIKKISLEYFFPFSPHLTMEPQNSTALVSKKYCEVWAPCQKPEKVIEDISKEIGIEKKNIKLNLTLIGGGFGRRYESDYILDSVLLSQYYSKPVKVIWDRDEDIAHDWYRPASVNKITALIKDEKIHEWDHHVVSPSINIQRDIISRSVYQDQQPVIGCQPNYPIKNRISRYTHKQYPITVGWWYGPDSKNRFACETFIDFVAKTLKKDPLHYRQFLLQENNWRESATLRAVLEKVASMASWNNGEGKKKGHYQGVACVYECDSFVAHIVEISISQGKPIIHDVYCAVDCGLALHPDIVRSQIEGGILWDLSAVLYMGVDFQNGQARQSNFHDQPILRIDESPRIHVEILESSDTPRNIGGGFAAGAALANAWYRATGKMVTQLPMKNNVF